jgi:hypothetical protein
MRVLLRGINSAIARRPVAAATTITATKAACADLLIQTYVERRKHIDHRRSFLFGSFGFLYQGCFQYFLYNHVFEAAFPGSRLRNVVCKVLASNLIADPVFFFPTFYTFREAINKGTMDTGCVVDGLTAYRYARMRCDLQSSAGTNSRVPLLLYVNVVCHLFPTVLLAAATTAKTGSTLGLFGFQVTL